jgi:diaminopimelate epimerase
VTITFLKYQGTGNDFIMLDNTSGQHDNLSIEEIQKMCDRKFGIGADGLIRIDQHAQVDFQMTYYNADGTQSFCGNGARCAVAFAGFLGLLKSAQTEFIAIDGKHQAWLCQEEVKLKMADVLPIKVLDAAFELHTGSPHYVILDDNHQSDHVMAMGREIRYSPSYKTQGINVNLLSVGQNSIRVATYERGVENETLSCGTGVTAAALVVAQLQKIPQGSLDIQTKGGQLKVQWQQRADGSYTEVYLIGPAISVYKGNYLL